MASVRQSMALFIGTLLTTGAVVRPAIIAAPQQNAHPTFVSLAKLAREHYLPVAAAQMGIVRGLSDVVAQTMVAYSSVPLRWAPTVAMQCTAGNCASFSLDIGHAAAMALVGLTTSGCGGALWLRHLESRLGPTAGSTRLGVQKSLADYTCWAPVVNSLNLMLVPLLCAHGVEASLSNVHNNLVPLMQLELLLFGPFNLVIFSRDDLIPPELRPTVKAMLSFVFSVGLSASCS
jgi:hypothetical protein